MLVRVEIPYDGFEYIHFVPSNLKNEFTQYLANGKQPGACFQAISLKSQFRHNFFGYFTSNNSNVIISLEICNNIFLKTYIYEIVNFAWRKGVGSFRNCCAGCWTHVTLQVDASWGRQIKSYFTEKPILPLFVGDVVCFSQSCFS